MAKDKCVLEIKNLEPFIANLNFLNPTSRGLMTRQLRKSAVNMQKEAKEVVAYKTGRLRSSINLFYKSPGLLRYEAGNQTNVEYALAIEKGSSGQRARPYMIPALDHEYPKFKKAIRAIMIAAMKL